jgi:hypothetical protein
MRGKSNGELLRISLGAAPVLFRLLDTFPPVKALDMGGVLDYRATDLNRWVILRSDPDANTFCDIKVYSCLEEE